MSEATDWTCPHCGRVYDDLKEGPCPSDDCPSHEEAKNKNVVALLRAASLLIRHCNINNIAVCNVNTDFIADLSKAVDAAEDFFDPWITDEELLAWQDE